MVAKRQFAGDPAAGARRWRGGDGLRRWVGVLLAVLLLWPLAVNAGGAAVVTIVDGDARVVDGTHAFAPAVGMRLAPGALIDTAADATLLRIEWDDGRALDLGPATRAMISPPVVATRRVPMLYLLTGWAKQTTGVVVDAQTMPLLELGIVSGVVVSHVAAERSTVFVESGRVELVGRATREAVALRQGDSVSVGGAERLVARVRAPAGFTAQLPRSFRDTIPHRLSQLGSRTVEGRALPPPAYADLAPWLAAEAAIRREFPRRFAALAGDPAFRDALQARLAAHPEWETVLNAARPARPAAAASH